MPPPPEAPAAGDTERRAGSTSELAEAGGGRAGFKSGLFWLGLVVSAVFGYLAVRSLDLSRVADTLRSSDWIWILPALVALAAGVFFKVLRWQALFATESRPSLGAISSALMIGYLFNNILPVRAGEVIRALVLNQRAAIPRTQALATVALERTLDVLCLVALLFLALPWLPPLNWAATAATLGAVLACVVLVAVVLLGPAGRPARDALARILALLPLVSRGLATRLVDGTADGLTALRQPRLALPALFWTTISWIAIAVSSWLLMRGFDLDLSPVSGLLVVVAINLSLVLPSAPAAIGVWEAATLVALRAYDVDSESALAYALVLHAVNLVPFLLVGAIALRLHATALQRIRSA